MTVSRCAVVVHAARVLGVGILVDGLTAIFVGKEFLDFPGIRLDTDRELQVLLGDGVPELRHC